MKRLATLTITIVAVFALSVCLAGCSKGGATDNGGSNGGSIEAATTTTSTTTAYVPEALGTWYGEEASTDDTDEWIMLSELDISVVLVINEDNTFDYSIYYDGETINDHGIITHDASEDAYFASQVEGGKYVLQLTGTDNYTMMIGDDLVMISDDGASTGTVYFTLVR